MSLNPTLRGGHFVTRLATRMTGMLSSRSLTRKVAFFSHLLFANGFLPVVVYAGDQV